MDRFQLVTDLSPKGDQPQAIDALSRGVKEGKKFQTLLGVTGSGKSLGADEPIWIYEEKADGLRRPVFGPIGPLVDQIMIEAGSQVFNADGTEIADANVIPRRYVALSLDPERRTIELKPVLSFLRHRSPKTLYRVKTTCGREVTVTGDHNFWVLRQGKLMLVTTRDITTSDYLPFPPKLPVVHADLEKIDITNLLAAHELLVEAPTVIARAAARRGREAVVQVLGRHYVFPQQKLWKIECSSQGRGIPLTVLYQIADTCGVTVMPQDIERVAVSSQFHTHTLPNTIPLSNEWLRLLGYYVAEGHGEPSYRFFSITNSSPTVVKDLRHIFSQLGLTYRRRDITFHITSKIHTILLANLCGVRARLKRLPSFWPELSQRQLAVLLSAYFDGDGCVTPRSGVVAPTASKELASDLAYALLRFGIWARIYKTWQTATNSGHAGAYYWYVTISGRENLRAFQQHLRFRLPTKQEALDREAATTTDAKKDLIPDVGGTLRRLRRGLGISQEALASSCGLSRTTLTVIEQGRVHPRRATMQKILSGTRGKPLDDHEAFCRLESLMSSRWTAVAEVEEIPSQGPYVYDLSVSENETFFGGFGGVFVHNTFAVANVIERVQKPTLLISHNKTLSAQLYGELKSFFPHNAVEYFVSYYDFYQPEAYVPHTDTYIEKDASINDDLDRLRLSATSSLLTRRDTIIVATVSCIYSLGDPEEYKEQMVWLVQGKPARRDELLSWLVGIHYTRNDVDFKRGTFRARGDIVDIYPAYRQTAYRIELAEGRIARIREIDPLTADTRGELPQIAIYPAKHFVTNKERSARAAQAIEQEQLESVRAFQAQGKLLEAQRLESRTKYDLEMLKELGYCHGVENYARHLSGRAPGSRPNCLIDYFPKDFLMVIDESHVTVPQIRGMYEGDRARKETLVEYGFRLPSALDNRPQRFDEFETLLNQVVFISATPGPYELKACEGQVVEQVIRPTGLVDPAVTIKPTDGQIDDLIAQVRGRARSKERVLVTTLTKRLSEDLTRYLSEANLRVKYLHSEIEAIERVEILRDLRRGEFDCLVGINLLREGLDLPEVSLVAVLDADKEGFLRSATSLIQVAGRAARNVNGEVILYADHLTGAMRRMLEETSRRRAKQLEFNQRHRITPTTITKAIRESIEVARQAEAFAVEQSGQSMEQHRVRQVLSDLEDEMLVCAKGLQFERAAELRDEIHSLKEKYRLTDEPRKRPARSRT